MPLDEVPDVWEGVVSVFRDYGYRRLRAKARLKFLIKDWGVEKFREVLETEYLKRPLIDGPAPEPVPHHIDHVGVQRLKNGLNAVGVAPIAGRVSGTILTKVADLAEAAGSDRVRFTPYQKLVILDVPDDKLDELHRRAGRAGPAGPAVALAAEPDGLHRHRVLQAVASPRPASAAQGLVPELEKRLEDINAQLDVPVTVNINGCPNSCARIQIADIGFKGQMVDDGDGAGRGLPGASGRQPGPGQRFRPQAAPAQGDRPPSSATTSSESCATS